MQTIVTATRVSPASVLMHLHGFVMQANRREDLYPQPGTRNNTNFFGKRAGLPFCRRIPSSLEDFYSVSCLRHPRVSPMTDSFNQAQSSFPPAAFAGLPVPGRDDNALTFPSDSVVVHSLPCLPWDFSSPDKAILPGWALCALLLSVCNFAPDPASQQQLASMPVPYLTLTTAASTRILSTLSSCGLFASPVPYNSLRSRLSDALASARAAGSCSAFSLSSADHQFYRTYRRQYASFRSAEA
eukprot:6185849-Pleurochrysis_carterae.AAC.1